MESKKINLLMAINQKYVPQMKVLLYSIADSNEAKVDVYLMHRELSSKDLSEIKYIVQEKLRGALHEIHIKDEFLENARINHHFSVEMYYRIFASEFLPQNIDRILWLDADIVVKGSLQEFYNSDFKGKSLIVCAHREKDEEHPRISAEAWQRLKLRGGQPYFNSGVILMNLSKIRKEFDKTQVCNLIDEFQNVLNYPDQDILNMIYEDDVLFADKNKYNFQIHYNWFYPNEKDHVNNDVVVLHYAGPAKPWLYKSRHFTYKYYWNYYLIFGKKNTYIRYEVLSRLYAIYKKIITGGR